MYFSNESEFHYALYHAYYSTYKQEIKKSLLEQIYQEYIDSDFIDQEIDDLFYDLQSQNFKPAIDNDFFKLYNGRIFSIDQLMQKKIKIHYLEKAEYVEKITTINKKCLMCSSTNIYTYTGSFDKISYCLDCVNFATSKSNEYRFLISYKNKEKLDIKKPNIDLSEQQELASNFLIENSKGSKTSLIWAVCGAGKTEIIYDLIYQNLINNKTVCIAIPRKDVVKELATRIEKDFDLKINILHGDDKVLLGQNIYIMTCHQLFYYYKFFDLIVVDEVDAFPYNGNDVLEYGMKKALKDSSPLIFLSATPSDKIKSAVDEIFKVPIRYHKHLLPLPYIKINKTLNENLINSTTLTDIENFIKTSLNNNRRILIFVPSIQIGQDLANSTSYNFVSSKSENRADLVESFRKRDFDVLITTTILERGITLDYLDVFVFYADHQTFSKEALIQIAGRVGRKDYDPSGQICFYATQNSKAIKSAIKEIDYMNELAKFRKLVRE